MKTLSAFLVVGIVFTLSGAARADEFKNLQVLPKSTTKPQLKEYMKAMSKALGAECDSCHESPDMASDANENKKVARMMMKMTDELNAKWIKTLKGGDKHPVTCGTCHRGKMEPEPFVAPAAK